MFFILKISSFPHVVLLNEGETKHQRVIENECSLPPFKRVLHPILGFPATPNIPSSELSCQMSPQTILRAKLLTISPPEGELLKARILSVWVTPGLVLIHLRA